jgi:hypothetical protein
VAAMMRSTEEKTMKEAAMTKGSSMKPANPRILTINGGSSSIKFALFEAGDSLRRILEGGIERIGLQEATLRVKGLNQADNFSRLVTAPDHTVAVRALMDWIEERIGRDALPAVGHRVMHGGPKYSKPQRITAEMVEELHRLSSFDPEHLPDLKIRVVNVVDLMKLQPQTEHPHGLSDTDFDEFFTKDKPVIFAFHAYPWLIHRLTYRRTNHDHIHVRGYKEEGTITTPFDMTVLNELDRFHLVMDTIDRLPQTGDKGIYLKQQLKDKLIEHKQYIDKHGQDMPEIRNWKWGNPK